VHRKPFLGRTPPRTNTRFRSLLHSSRQDFEDHKGMGRKEKGGAEEKANEADMEREGSKVRMGK